MKIFLLFTCFILLIVNVNSVAQGPSLSDLSGNGPTPDNKGYTYDFKGPRHYNCYEFYIDDNYTFNLTHNTNYSFVVDTINHNLRVNFNGSQTGEMTNQFTAGNCGWYIADFSKNETNYIIASVKSSVDIQNFGLTITTGRESNDSWYTPGLKSAPVFLKKDQWTLVQIPVVYGQLQTSKYVSGFGVFAENLSSPYPVGYVDIDYILMGSAAKVMNDGNLVLENRKGYELDFSSDSLLTCKEQFNLKNNNNFVLNKNESACELNIQQIDTSIVNDSLVINFNDSYCYQTKLNLSNPFDRFIKLNLNSDIVTPEFSVVAISRNMITQQLDYSKVLNTFKIQPSTIFSEINIPIAMMNEIGEPLDSTMIEGLAFVFNNHKNVYTTTKRSAKLSTVSTPLNLTLNYLKVGGNTIITNRFDDNNSDDLTIYPNPVNYGNNINISLDKALLSGSVNTVSILNVNGISVFNTVFEEKISIEKSLLSSGIYFINVSNGSQSFIRKLIVL